MKTIYFESIDSTNNYGKELLKSESFEHGTLLYTYKQTGGRGRKGRSFLSEGGLYMSVLFHPTNLSFPITCAAAVAVRDAVKELSPETDLKIKWVNDLFFGGKKVCGILTEAQTENNSVHGFVCGIGINTRDTHFSEEIEKIATKINISDRESLAKNIAERLVNMYDKNQNPIPSYRSHLILNVPVSVYKNGVFQFDGIAKDVNENGNLLVYENGALHTLSSGEISIKLQEIK